MIKRPKWNEKYSVNAEKIDLQHKKLFDIINSTIDVYESGHGELLPVFKELADYLQYHFATENEYMLEHEYPDFLAHHKEHQKFTKKMLSFLDRADEAKSDLARDVLIFLKEWYVDHVPGTDKNMGLFLKGKL
ncbi:bacteriohemerythrin [Thermodesulfobacteriota bacterium]